VSIPQITAVAQNNSPSIRIDNCKSLDGTVADRTTKIIVKQNNDSIIYKVIFLKQPQPNNTKLNAIIVDGDSIENFVQGKNSFKINLPYTAISSPSIIPITAATSATYIIEPATNILGSTNERTAKIIVTSEDKTATESYSLVFNILPKLDLFLLIGQSNMCGRGTMTPEYMDTLSNTFLLTPRAEMEPAVNPINKYSTVRKDLIYEQVGPGYGFSKSLVYLTGSNIGLVSNARGATAISSWTKGSVDRLYEEAVLRMKAALKWGILKAILWHQGEADSKNPDSYKTKLYNMVQNLRTDLESPNVFFVAGELAYWRDGGTGSTAFNSMIRTISTFIPNTSWVSAEGLTPLIDVTDPHFDAKSQVIFGGRYADEVIKYCYNSTKLVQPQNTNNSITFTTDKNTVHIKNTNNEIVSCSIYLTNGMLVNRAKSSSDFDLKISKSGIYIINISSEKFNMVYKIVI